MMELSILVLAVTLTRRAAWAAAAPAPGTFLDEVVYTAEHTWYAGHHDIVDIHLPLHLYENGKMFFVEADLTNNSYRGLFELNFNDKKKTVRKILENGKCITSDEEAAYFGATDGVYRYNFTDNSVAKYGTVTADVKDIEKLKGEDLIYVVTEDNRLHRVTERGDAIKEHDVLTNVERIAIDVNNNLYFYQKHDGNEDYVPFYEKYTKPRIALAGVGTVLDVSGLPDKYTSIALAGAPSRDGAVVVLNNNIYHIRPNGSASDTRQMFLHNPTAYFLEAGLLQLYGHDKKLYYYSVLEKLDLSGLRLDLVVRPIIQSVVETFKNFSFTTKT